MAFNNFNNNNQFMNSNFGLNNNNNYNAFYINNSNNMNCMNNNFNNLNNMNCMNNNFNNLNNMNCMNNNFNNANNMNCMNNNFNNLNNMNCMNNNFNNANNINCMNNNFNNLNNMNCMNNNFNNENNMNCINNINFLNDMYNNNNRNDMNEMNNKNQINYNHFNVSFVIMSSGLRIQIVSSSDEKVKDLIDKFFNKIGIPFKSSLIFIFNSIKLEYNSLTLAEVGIGKDPNTSIIVVIDTDAIKGAGYTYNKEINIKFLKLPNSSIYKNDNQDIIGILKLCLLKEVSQKLTDDNLKQIPDIINYIMKILQRGYIEENPYNIKQNIKDVLDKMMGSNIINFSNYVDKIIDSYQLDKILSLLEKGDLKEMLDIKNRLSRYNKYIKLFNQEFEKSKRESYFEFSVISLVVIEREDLDIFEREREKCPNRIERILYHGTSVEPISGILTGLYRKSLEKKKAINGPGVYFTDLLDYGWYYGGKGGNRANFSGIPKIDDTFTVIINSVYYDKNGFEQVKNSSRKPGKNQINFAYAGARSERLNLPDKTKFLASEYVIYELDQICPFMSATLKRVKYCVIWRDDNFSSKPVYNNKFDQIFKDFLKERMKYINQMANYNIYPCETTEEALELVKRKKYNKIILISNVGKDKAGKTFIDKAREIIGNDVIALFLAYKTSHLKWIKDYKNALFSNDPKFYEEYLSSFGNENKILELIKKMEKHYDVKFNFDDKYLYFPNFKENGKYGEMQF